LPLHPAASRAVYLFLRAIRDADAETVHRFGPQAVEVLLRSGEVEAARDMIERVLSEPAPADRADQAERLRRLAGELDVGLARAEAEIARYRRREGSPPRLAALMATPALGMTPSAIELLEAHRGSLGDSDLRLLGDMYLRLGLPEAARPNFEQIARNSPGEAQRPEIRLRLALCDAVEGEFFRAEERLRADDDEPMPANLHYTRAAILEILGRYEQALAALDAMEGNQTGVNIERVAGRLRRRLMSYLGSDSSPSGGREGF
jgi:tetratricopeptide (TPR) repeat protein